MKLLSSKIALLLPLVAGCGALIGIDDAHVDPTFDPTGLSVGGSGGAAAGSGGSGGSGGSDTAGSGGSDTAGSGGSDGMGGGTAGTSSTGGAGNGGVSGSGGSGGQASCGHDVCTKGDALAASCSSCAMTICSTFPTCCVSAWGDLCVQQATGKCGCGAGGAGGVGQGGSGQGGAGQGGVGPGMGGAAGMTGTNCVGPGAALDIPVAAGQMVVHVVNCGGKSGTNGTLRVHATLSGMMMPSAVMDVAAQSLPFDITLSGLTAGTYTVDATWDFPPAQQMGMPPGTEDAAGGVPSLPFAPIKGAYVEINLH